MIIQRIVATLLGVLLLIAVFVFVSFLLAVAVTAGLLLGGWMWWRSRGRDSDHRWRVGLRWRVGRRGRVIEGESREVRDRNYHLRP